MTLPIWRIEAICREILKNDLEIKVEEGGFTDPNGRSVILLLEGKEISRCSIDIKSRREYEG